MTTEIDNERWPECCWLDQNHSYPGCTESATYEIRHPDYPLEPSYGCTKHTPELTGDGETSYSLETGESWAEMMDDKP